jgi:tetratricopeptide (TPR) repeat protein
VFRDLGEDHEINIRKQEYDTLINTLASPIHKNGLLLGDDDEVNSSLVIQVLRAQEMVDCFGQRRYFISCSMASTVTELFQVITTVLDSTVESWENLFKFLGEIPTFLILHGLNTAWGYESSEVENLIQQISERATLVVTMRKAGVPKGVDWDLVLPIQALPRGPRDRDTIQPIFNVDHNPTIFFTGCEHILSSIRATFQNWEALNPDNLNHVQTITGMGGIGKTRLAVEYSHRFKNEYTVVHWIAADSLEALDVGYIALAKSLGLPEAKKDDPKQIVAAALNWLSSCTGWLLIFDNVDDYVIHNKKSIEKADVYSTIKERLPKKIRGHVLITSRQVTTNSFFRVMQMPCMNPEIGALFLLRRSRMIDMTCPLSYAPKEDVETARELVEEMGGLPLAIDQAGGHISYEGLTLKEYQELYMECREELWKERGNETDPSSALHASPVFITFTTSFRKIETDHNAEMLLKLCAVLHPDKIPKDMLTVGAQYLYPGTAMPKRAMQKAISPLRQYSLILLSRDNTTITIHRLVQEILLTLMKDSLSTIRELVYTATRMVDTSFPFVNYGTLSSATIYLPHAEVCSGNIAKYSLVDQFSEIQRVPQILPITAHLLYYLGSYFYYIGQYTRAEEQYRFSKMILEKVESSELETQTLKISVIRALAQAYWRTGHYKESSPNYKQALKIAEELYGQDSRETALTLHQYARVLGEQGKYEECNTLFERTLHIWRESTENDKVKMLARSEHEFARLLGVQGFHKRAEELSSGALEVFKRPDIAGPSHPTTASILRALIRIRMDQGRYGDAEEKLKWVQKVMEEGLGENHIEVGTTCHELASVYHRQEKYEEAKELYKKALDIYESSLQEYDKGRMSQGHPDTVATLSGLASVYRAQGNFDEAEKMYQRALSICSSQLTAEHVGAIAVRKDFAELLRQLGRGGRGAGVRTNAQEIHI